MPLVQTCAQLTKDVTSHQPPLAAQRGTIARNRMHPAGRSNQLTGCLRGTLREQGGGYAGQHIAHTGTRHTGITGAHQPRPLVSANQCAGTLEQNRPAVALLQAGESPHPLTLDIRCRHTQQAPGFARMRCQHPVVTLHRVSSQQIERIGINYQRQTRGQDPAEQLTRPVIAAETRPDRDQCRASQQLIELAGFEHPATHQLRPPRDHSTDILGPRGDAHETGTRTQCRFAGKPHRAAHTLITADHQHMPVTALVTAACPRRQHPPEQLRTGTLQLRADPGGIHGPDTQIAVRNPAAAIRPGAQVQTLFQTDKGRGEVRAHRHTLNRAARAMQARRDIDRKHRQTRTVNRRHRIGIATLDGTLQPRAEQCIDTESRTIEAEISRQKVFSRTAGGQKILVGGRRITLQRGRVRDRQHAHLQPGSKCQLRDDIAVATVVAAAAKYHPVIRSRESFARGTESHLPGPLHQFVTGNALLLNRDTIELAHLVRRVYPLRHTHPVIIICCSMSHQSISEQPRSDPAALAAAIKQFAAELGFQQTGISDIDLAADEEHLQAWLAQGRHGEMGYMERHGTRRSRPAELVPGTVSVISVRMDYLPDEDRDPRDRLEQSEQAYVSRYALGRDYHKLIRNRLQKLADRVAELAGPFGYRVFTDSAPVLEKALARNAGLGWIGKHTNLINKDAGSWFFLGEIYTDLPLPPDSVTDNHCGTCTACLDCCPTNAIVAPYEVDARRCISYLTIELHDAIPVELRELIGNRIYGCDDCQLFCPWNKFAEPTGEGDFAPRHGLDDSSLAELFAWSEAEWEARTAGSAIRRIGYERWLRNIAVALGNADTSDEIIAALTARAEHDSALVREHVSWALGRHGH